MTGMKPHCASKEVGATVAAASGTDLDTVCVLPLAPTIKPARDHAEPPPQRSLKPTHIACRAAALLPTSTVGRPAPPARRLVVLRSGAWGLCLCGGVP